MTTGTRFQGKAAIVTGGGSGIGAEISRQLAAEGASVVVTDIKLDSAQQVVDEITAADGAAVAFEQDTTDPDQSRAAVDFAVEQYGALHLAVNNAGIGGPARPTGEYAIEDWNKVVATNLSGVFYSMRYELPAILASGGGAVVNMASILGTNGFAGSPAYVAAKHGVVGLTKTAALEYAAQNVRSTRSAPASSTPRCSATPTPRPVTT